eukprot:TRINITY_DN8964_c0_g1_i1.p1 TRINITY_DN8964_c0_g1~~TRINITY_DN8964_c0_g1_i1.p1  ORF type:complete len:208 (+),score=37.17 TRINITY_DN8964_c0_g1_i1:491-1114(+)
MMTFDHFLDRFIFKKKERNVVGRIANHLIFDQFPELKEDIKIPDYSELVPGGVKEIYATIEPPLAVTPLHSYTHETRLEQTEHQYQNLVAQVTGYKYFRIYHPAELSNLYPNTERFLIGTSQVDVEFPDLLKHSLFSLAGYVECILRPNDFLYIPPGHWHWSKSLSYSCSLSFRFVCSTEPNEKESSSSTSNPTEILLKALFSRVNK